MLVLDYMHIFYVFVTKEMSAVFILNLNISVVFLCIFLTILFVVIIDCINVK